MDDKLKNRPQDAQLDMHEDYELRYWMEQFGVNRADLERVYKKFGPMVKDVERELKAA